MIEDHARGPSGNPYAVDRLATGAFERQAEAPISREEDASPLEILEQFSEQDRARIRIVKYGLLGYYFGLLLLSLCWFCSVFFAGQGVVQVAMLFQFGTGLGLLIVLVGELMCLAVPKRAGGFVYVLFSSLFYALSVVAYFVIQSLRLNGGLQAEPWFLLQMLQLCFGFLANVLFLTFIIRLMRSMSQRRLFEAAVKIRQEFWRMITYFCIVILMFAILLQQRLANGKQLAFLVLGTGAIGFVLLVYTWLQKFSRLVRDAGCSIVIETQLAPMDMDP
ncbi:MAG: hypothetical protein VX438_10460 [Planctomycetota bacterium]|nr:hypothetical protein [Planctomycetota bacterium]